MQLAFAEMKSDVAPSEHLLGSKELYTQVCCNPLTHGALQQQEMKAVLAQAEGCSVYVKNPKNYVDIHGKLKQQFDYWADAVAHLLLLKSSMVDPITCKYSCHNSNNNNNNDVVIYSPMLEPSQNAFTQLDPKCLTISREWKFKKLYFNEKVLSQFELVERIMIEIVKSFSTTYF